VFFYLFGSDVSSFWEGKCAQAESFMDGVGSGRLASVVLHI